VQLLDAVRGRGVQNGVKVRCAEPHLPARHLDTRQAIDGDIAISER